mgnify:FL=1
MAFSISQNLTTLVPHVTFGMLFETTLPLGWEKVQISVLLWKLLSVRVHTFLTLRKIECLQCMVDQHYVHYTKLSFISPQTLLTKLNESMPPLFSHQALHTIFFLAICSTFYYFGTNVMLMNELFSSIITYLIRHSQWLRAQNENDWMFYFFLYFSGKIIE